MEPIPPLEPTIFGAMWRYRWLVLATVAVFAGLGLLYSANQARVYVANASLIVEDPRTSSPFEQPSGQPQRYVADQVEILRSAAVAERAAELANQELPEAGFATEVFLTGAQVVGRGDSDLIQISFVADDPRIAQAGANALAQAYQDVRRSEAAKNASAALERLDASLQGIDDDLASLQAEITSDRPADQFSDPLRQQFADAIARVVDLQAERASTTDPDRLEEIRSELDDLFRQFQTLQLIRNVEAQEPGLAVLLNQQQAAIERRTELAARRDQIAVDAELASSGVTLFSPARLPAQPVGGGMFRTLAVALVLGALAGAGLAYLLALRRRTFSNRAEPQMVLGAPLLAEVPGFAEEGIKSQVPVWTAPTSAAAEAFRFVAAAIDIQAAGAGATSLVFVSAALGDGKTTVVANTAMAAAREGSRVLIIDTDFGNQALTHLLRGDAEPQRGLTEVVEAGLGLREAAETVQLAEDVRLTLLGRGRLRVTAANFFRAPATQQFFEQVGREFDLVLVDTPPLLRVAYASTVVRYADAAVAVVPHDSDVADLEELSARLTFIGTPVAGYIYNFAPLRPEVTASEGSLKDILGVGAEELARRGARHKG
ncbi:MAG: AAA family ATPase [Acidimicrobiia bacterium]